MNPESRTTSNNTPKAPLAFDQQVTFWPFFVLLLVTSFYWWGRFDVGVLKVPLAALFVIPISYFTLLRLPSRRFFGFNLDKFDKRCSFALYAMLVSMLGSVLLAENVWAAIGVFSEMAFYVFLFFLIIATLRTRSGVVATTATLLLGITFLAAAGLYSFFVTETAWRVGAGDVHAPTNMGAFMYQAAILLLLSRLIFFHKTKVIYRRVVLFALFLVIAAFALTYSRGAWITIIAGMLVIVSHRRSLTFPLLVTLLVSLPFMPNAITNRLLSTFDTQANQSVTLHGGAEIRNTTRMRLDNWTAAVSDISSNPLLGLGIGYYHGESMEKGEGAPHNAYLRMWAESGPVALLAFVSFLWLVIRRVAHSIHNASTSQRWYVIGYCAILTTHVFYMLLGDWPYQIYFWVLIAFAVSATNTVSRIPGRCPSRI